MVSYYKTPGGLYYKELSTGGKVRVSRSEYSQSGGAAKKKSPKKSPKKKSKKTSKKSPKKASSKRSPKKMSAKRSHKRMGSTVEYTEDEKKCLDEVYQKIRELAPGVKEGKYPHMGAVYAISYKEVGDAKPECSDFFQKEKERKDIMKAERKAKRGSKKRRSPKKSSKTRSKKRSATRE